MLYCIGSAEIHAPIKQVGPARRSIGMGNVVVRSVKPEGDDRTMKSVALYCSLTAVNDEIRTSTLGTPH